MSNKATTDDKKVTKIVDTNYLDNTAYSRAETQMKDAVPEWIIGYTKLRIKDFEKHREGVDQYLHERNWNSVKGVGSMCLAGVFYGVALISYKIDPTSNESLIPLMIAFALNTYGSMLVTLFANSIQDKYMQSHPEEMKQYNITMGRIAAALNTLKKKEEEEFNFIEKHGDRLQKLTKKGKKFVRRFNALMLERSKLNKHICDAENNLQDLRKHQTIVKHALNHAKDVDQSKRLRKELDAVLNKISQNERIIEGATKVLQKNASQRAKLFRIVKKLNVRRGKIRKLLDRHYYKPAPIEMRSDLVRQFDQIIKDKAAAKGRKKVQGALIKDLRAFGYKLD